MKTYTLRGLNDATVEKLRNEARRTGSSINKLIVNLIENTFSGNKFTPQTYNDLDHLFGKLHDEDSRIIEKVSSDLRTIDEDMWQ